MTDAPRVPARSASTMDGRLSGEDPWSELVVLDRLEVGPITLEPRRLTAPYRVVRGGEVATNELVYRYEEDVFEPGDERSANLAAMIAAQVALNYGLFAREIVFRGPFDEADRRFLADMAENTAREITVKKFLEPNPFLAGSAAHLPAVRRDRYLVAELVFPDPKPAEERAWGGDPRRAAVLSSGGKDSLLSFGVLEEIGVETHSVFINESGRHWYTALNAFRHLRETRPETTTRVWTSSDRIFSWMLRHLSFVRPDFASVRADIYPVRLWTVAVFLFGALPVLRKRGLGRLIIGDEYETTVRLSHQGIPHYDGLYDQSRWFDDALSRYYRRKGFALSQFSLLRPLAELTIQKILVERFPELQRHQVSCHAAHVEGDRVRPCGRCEKCRRIVGMLVALDQDPARSGYAPEQVRHCLDELVHKNIHQESIGAQHLASLLVAKGLLPPDARGLGPVREHEEIKKLRFHPEKCPPNWIPLDLREPVLRIFSEHTEGAIERRGRVWAPIDPFHSAAFRAPYPFDAPAARAAKAAGAAAAAGGFVLGRLSWPEAKRRFAEVDIALLPVGATEQHGPHLPLDVDAWDAEELCRRVAIACTDPKPLVLPLIPYGVSYHHDDFPGTLSISPQTLSRLVYEVGISAARHGITKLVIVNGHGGNAATLQLAAQLINRDAHIFCCVDSGETSDHDIGKIVATPGDAHAGEIETSTTLATRPELVDMSRAERCVPEFSSQYLDFTSQRGVEWFAPTVRMSSTGIMGDPTKASKEKGEEIWRIMTENLCEFVEELKRVALDEIFERRL